MSIRTRFAPSPTGYIHVGNVRAALFPWLLARQQKGVFILRVEDTDQARFMEGATDLILDTLEWLGLDWDEGPRVGGGFGPYVQSERREIYLKWAQKLIDKDLAYADPYTPEEVQAFREEAKALKRPFLYRDHRPENPPVWDGSQPLRFKVTDIRHYEWHDPVMGNLSAGPEALDDFILVKSDGLPTYNFAHIVDDAEMGVTHVIRGLEYISSIPRYLSLYDALELTPPVLACLPHIMAPDGKKKLGKRDGAKSVSDYRTDGILPEAMLNFLSSMGWNDGTEQEIFTIQELIEKFSLERVQRSGARFDEQRLLWMNGQWIRSLELDDLYLRVSGKRALSATGPAGRSTPSSSNEASRSDSEGVAPPPVTPMSADEGRSFTSQEVTPSEMQPNKDLTEPVSFPARNGDFERNERKGSSYWSRSAEGYDEAYKKQVLSLVKDRLKTLAELPMMTRYFFEEPEQNLVLITENKMLKKLSREQINEFLNTAKDELSKVEDWSPENIQNCLNHLLEITGQKPGVLFSLIRIVTTWAPFSPQLNDTLALLGKERILKRIKAQF